MLRKLSRSKLCCKEAFIPNILDFASNWCLSLSDFYKTRLSCMSAVHDNFPVAIYSVSCDCDIFQCTTNVQLIVVMAMPSASLPCEQLSVHTYCLCLICESVSICCSYSKAKMLPNKWLRIVGASSVAAC